MSEINYGIDDGDGNQITTGLPAHTARRTAQRIADERGESVYLYPLVAGDDDDDGPEAEEIKPTEEIEPVAGPERGIPVADDAWSPTHRLTITSPQCHETYYVQAWPGLILITADDVRPSPGRTYLLTREDLIAAVWLEHDDPPGSVLAVESEPRWSLDRGQLHYRGAPPTSTHATELTLVHGRSFSVSIAPVNASGDPL